MNVFWIQKFVGVLWELRISHRWRHVKILTPGQERTRRFCWGSPSIERHAFSDASLPVWKSFMARSWKPKILRIFATMPVRILIQVLEIPTLPVSGGRGGFLTTDKGGGSFWHGSIVLRHTTLSLWARGLAKSRDTTRTSSLNQRQNAGVTVLVDQYRDTWWEGLSSSCEGPLVSENCCWSQFTGTTPWVRPWAPVPTEGRCLDHADRPEKLGGLWEPEVYTNRYTCSRWSWPCHQ